MTRHRLRLVPLIACLAAACAPCDGDGEPATAPSETPSPPEDRPRSGTPERPNVLLVVADTLRADDLGCYGLEHPTSPSIDALAERGTRFERHQATASSTLASMTSILTGAYTRTHGVYRNGVEWPEGLEGVVPRVREAGWDTAAFVASFALDARFGMDRGFDHYDDRQSGDYRGGDRWGRNFRRADEMTDAALRWLDTRERPAKPFFALVHYYDPHYPYAPPEEHFRPFDVGYEGDLTGSLRDMIQVRRAIEGRDGELGVEGRHARALHWGEVRFVDAEIDRLLRGLADRGLDDRTLVVFTSDHGESFAEHQGREGVMFDHGWTVYRSEVHVPLIVAGPGVAVGRVVERRTGHVDIAPTLLDVLGIGWEGLRAGRSLAPLLAPGELPPPDAEERVLFAEATKPGNEHAALPEDLRDDPWPNAPNARCATAGPWKLVETPWNDRHVGLYDLTADPLARDDRFEDEDVAEVRERLQEHLNTWASLTPGDATGEMRVDEETWERLEALGYAR